MTPAARSLPQAVQRLDALLDWEKRARHDMRVGLEPVRDLLQRLGRPERAARVVHVAGSKGKGSVCAAVAEGLAQAGWRVGCLLSPHLQRLNERVRIQGHDIGDGELAAALHAALDARDAAQAQGGEGGAAGQATRFDVLIAASFLALQRAGVDWAVVETGLGGRDDSTNVVQPELAIVTSVGLEHTEVLGPTLLDIARHKAGIVKPGCQLLTPIAPPHPAWPALAEALAATGASWQPVDVSGLSISAANLAVARAALDALGQRGVAAPAHGRPLCAADLDAAAAQRARLPARLEHGRLGAAPGLPVVIDGAHTDFALQAVLDELAQDPRLSGPPLLLLALAADKPAERVLRAACGRVREVWTLSLDDGRPAWSADALAAQARSLGLRAQAMPDLAQALQRATAQARTQADGPAWLLVAGSLHLAARAREALAWGPRAS